MTFSIIFYTLNFYLKNIPKLYKNPVVDDNGRKWKIM